MSRPAALVDDDWVEQSLNIIERLALSQHTVTAEDILREHEAPEHQNMVIYEAF